MVPAGTYWGQKASMAGGYNESEELGKLPTFDVHPDDFLGRRPGAGRVSPARTGDLQAIG